MAAVTRAVNGRRRDRVLRPIRLKLTVVGHTGCLGIGHVAEFVWFLPTDTFLRLGDRRLRHEHE